MLGKNLSMSEDEVSFCPVEQSGAEPSFRPTASTLQLKFSTLSVGSITNQCRCLKDEIAPNKKDYITSPGFDLKSITTGPM